MVTHSSIAQKIPCTEEPGGLQSVGSQSWTQASNKHTFLGSAVTSCLDLTASAFAPVLVKYFLTLSLPHLFIPALMEVQILPLSTDAVQSLSGVGLFFNPKDCSPPGSSVHGISQVRVLEWLAISFSRGSSQPRIEPRSPALQMILYCLSHQGSPPLSIQEWKG